MQLLAAHQPDTGVGATCAGQLGGIIDDDMMRQWRTDGPSENKNASVRMLDMKTEAMSSFSLTDLGSSPRLYFCEIKNKWSRFPGNFDTKRQ